MLADGLPRLDRWFRGNRLRTLFFDNFELQVSDPTSGLALTGNDAEFGVFVHIFHCGLDNPTLEILDIVVSTLNAHKTLEILH